MGKVLSQRINQFILITTLRGMHGHLHLIKFLPCGGDKIDSGCTHCFPKIIWKYVKSLNWVYLIPGSMSFTSSPMFTAVLLGSLYHLSEEVKWPQNMTTVSLLTPICSLLILFIFSFSGTPIFDAEPLCPHLSWDIFEAEHGLSRREQGTHTIKNMLSNIYIAQSYFLY